MAVDLWLSVTVYLLIHMSHCVPGAYAAFMMDAREETVTDVYHAEVRVTILTVKKPLNRF